MHKEDLVYPGERVDDLQRNGLKIIQNPEFFCFGMDAVLLSSFVQVPKGASVMDLCTGNAVIPLLLQAKTEAGNMEGIEIQTKIVDLALRSVRLNHWEERVHIQQMDVKEVPLKKKGASFDVVTCNPPYMKAGHGLLNDRPEKVAARHETLCDLEDVIRAADHLLKTGGHFYMVHRPHRFVEILQTLEQFHLEPKDIQFVHPKKNKEANMVLIHGIKGAKPYLHVWEPLIIYKEDGTYSERVRRMYED